MATGWISIHREIQSHWLWEDKPFSKGQAWIDLILIANHEESRFVLGNQIIEAKRGDVITSEVKLSERWGWSRKKVRDYLALLENDSMIVKKTDSKKTVLTLVNYSVWQNSQTAKEHQKDSESTAEEQQKDIINNSNNLNNYNNQNNITVFFESLWKLYPRKEGKGQVSNAQKKKLAKIGFEEMSRAIERYKQTQEGTDRKFIQKGSTFFNSGYVDYLDANYQSEKLGGLKNGWYEQRIGLSGAYAPRKPKVQAINKFTQGL